MCNLPRLLLGVDSSSTYVQQSHAFGTRPVRTCSLLRLCPRHGQRAGPGIGNGGAGGIAQALKGLKLLELKLSVAKNGLDAEGVPRDGSHWQVWEVAASG